MKRLFDMSQYGTLLAAGLRLSLTGSRGEATDQAGAGEDGSRHLLGAAYSLTLSTIVAALLFTSASPGQFLFFTTSLSMVFTATAVIGELAGGLFHPLDLAVTGHLPVSGFTRFVARFTELVAALLVLTLNLNLTPAILFGFMATSASGPLLGAAAPFVVLAAGFCAALFTAGVCLVVYSLLARVLTTAQFQGALLYLNIFVSLAILGLLCNIGRLIKASATVTDGAGGDQLLFPPAWFSGSVLALLGLPGGTSASVLFAAVGLCAALLPLLAVAVGSESLLSALSGSRRAARAKSAPGTMMGLFEKLFVRADEKTAFEFTAVHLARDRGFRLKAYPILGVPILMMVISLFESKDPLFFILLLYLMNLYLPLVVSFLPFGDHFRAGWIFDALPAERPGSFARGAEKAFVYRIMLPLGLLNAVALSVFLSPVAGPLHALFAFLGGLFVVGARFRKLVAYPFSREFRGVVTNDFTGVLFGSLVIFTALAWFQLSTSRSLPLFVGLIAAMALLHKVRYRVLSRQCAPTVDPHGEGR